MPLRNAHEFYAPKDFIEWIQIDEHLLFSMKVSFGFKNGGRGEVIFGKEHFAEVATMFFDTTFSVVELDEFGTLTWYKQGEFDTLLSEQNVIYTLQQVVALATSQENAP